MSKIGLLFNSGMRKRLSALRPRLYRMAYAWCHDPHLSEDLAQEALARSVDRIDQLKDEAALESWVFAILNNCWRDYLRCCRNCVDVDDIDESVLAHDATPERLYASRQTTNRVQRAIARLSIGQRQVLTLVDIEELSYADVASVLAIPVGTVMSRLWRARQALKEMLMAEESANVIPLARRTR